MCVLVDWLAFFYEKISEKGHVKPADYLDAHEKFLLGVATKGGIHSFLLVVIALLYFMHYSICELTPIFVLPVLILDGQW